MQAGTKASTLATRWLLVGLAVYHPELESEASDLIVYFVLMTNPVSSHALARAATVGIPMTRETPANAPKPAQPRLCGIARDDAPSSSARSLV